MHAYQSVLGNQMQKDQKFMIIKEGQQIGVAATCRKHHISRTLYYRWLKKYHSQGFDGLEDVRKSFRPVNKLDDRIEKAILNLIRFHPRYGPRAIKYLLEEIGHHVSESGVFNVMKRHDLTTKESRIRFARKRSVIEDNTLPDYGQMKSGECWLFWITDYGTFDGIGQLYEYTFIDLKSRIACTRLYQDISLDNFKDLLTSVALPIAQALQLEIRYLCFLEDSRFLANAGKNAMQHTIEILTDYGFNISVKEMQQDQNDQEIRLLKDNYTIHCLTYVTKQITDGCNFKELKYALQKNIRDYNMSYMADYDCGQFTPISYHSHQNGSKLILPIWAYIDRDY